MNTVLLVDDERPVLDGLISALDWAEYGVKHIHTAQDAQEALQILEEHEIDLLISDILMPGMSGLEMLRLVRDRYPSTHCVLLSAHSKFEYARDALKLGVENYLLKPIDVAELQETVYRTAENIARTEYITRDLFDRNILERWLFGRISSDELVEHSRYTKLNALLRRYRVLLLSMPENKTGMITKLCTALQLNYVTHEILLEDHVNAILIGGREVTGEAIHEAIRTFLKSCPDITVICGSRATGNSEVSQSMADAQHTLAYARLTNKKGWVCYDEIDWAMLSAEALSELEDITRLDAPATRVKQWVTTFASVSQPEELQSFYAQACLALNRLIGDPTTSAQNRIHYRPFTSPVSIDRLQALISEAVTGASNNLRTRTKDLSPITHRILKYVAENLSGSVSIKHFAEKTRMNSAYLGRLFKDEMGMYFSDYVCLTRIEKAKKLLVTTDLSVGDIAHQVGIYDVSYFTQRFKKQERLSPMKYRQELRKTDQ